MGERQRHRNKERQRKKKTMDMKLDEYGSEEDLEILGEGKHDQNIFYEKNKRKKSYY